VLSRYTPYPEPAGLAGWVVTGPPSPPPTPRVGELGGGEPALFPTGRNHGFITKVKCRDQFSAEFKKYHFVIEVVELKTKKIHLFSQ